MANKFLMRIPEKWLETSDTAIINFGPVQLYCFPDPHKGGYRIKVGTLLHNKRYATMDRAKAAGLRYMRVLGETIIKGVDSMLGEKVEVEKEVIEQQPLSILGLGRDIE